MLSKGRVAMTPEELTGAARNLAHGLGIPVYIRDGRIYQQGPGLAFLPLINKNQGIGGPCQDNRMAKKGAASRLTG